MKKTKSIKQQLCEKCLAVYRKFEKERRNKYRCLRIKEVGSQEKGNIKL